MASRLLKDVYETPRISVRGVFLCDNLADTVSVLTIEITQEEWGTDVTLGDEAGEGGDLWLGY
jgi:hypothetical protein